MNPGLKEITHSITGGALAAQGKYHMPFVICTLLREIPGYWMPYSCARAVCATFCSHISGALIPIFGPSFPLLCIPKNDESYGQMVIDPSIIAVATVEANSFRQHRLSLSPNINDPATESPNLGGSLRSFGKDTDCQRPVRRNTDYISRRKRLKRTFRDTDYESSDTQGPVSSLYSPLTPSSCLSSPDMGSSRWTPSNTPMPTPPPPTFTSSKPRTALPFLNDSVSTYTRNRNLGHRLTASCGANPWLSAIPRSMPDVGSFIAETPFLADPPATSWRRSKRRAVATSINQMDALSQTHRMDVDIDMEKAYDGEESGDSSDAPGPSPEGNSISELDMKVATLLLELHIIDRKWSHTFGAHNFLATNVSASTGPTGGPTSKFGGPVKADASACTYNGAATDTGFGTGVVGAGAIIPSIGGVSTGGYQRVKRRRTASL
jgi:hypothetical protein